MIEPATHLIAFHMLCALQCLCYGWFKMCIVSISTSPQQGALYRLRKCLLKLNVWSSYYMWGALENICTSDDAFKRNTFHCIFQLFVRVYILSPCSPINVLSAGSGGATWSCCHHCRHCCRYCAGVGVQRSVVHNVTTAVVHTRTRTRAYMLYAIHWPEISNFLFHTE